VADVVVEAVGVYVGACGRFAALASDGSGGRRELIDQTGDRTGATTTDQRADDRAARMARAQRGDRDTYHDLLAELDAQLRRSLRRRLWPGEEVDDACQDILLTLHRAMRTYDASRPFDPWFHALVTHVLQGARRSRRRRPVLHAVEPERLAEMAPDDAGDGDLERVVDAALGRLPSAQREAVRMLKIEGLSVEAAAERAGVSPGGMRVRAHRGYRALRALLGFDE
jgi:RNA polymerase sigma-70 factor (ECF subfamily)